MKTRWEYVIEKILPAFSASPVADFDGGVRRCGCGGRASEPAGDDGEDKLVDGAAGSD